MFEQYAVIPLDLPMPRLPPDELREFVYLHCDRAVASKNIVRYLLFFARKPVRRGKVVHDCDWMTEELPGRTRFAWDERFAEAFPAFVRWVERLPFSALHGVDLITQTDRIRDHLDIYGMNNAITYFDRYRQVEPRYYRVLITEEGDAVARGRSFYVTRNHGGRRQFVRLPRETCTFAMSASNCYHGAVFQRGHYKTTIALFGEVDPRRHNALLRRSLDKYGRWAIEMEPSAVGGPGAEMPYMGP